VIGLAYGVSCLLENDNGGLTKTERYAFTINNNFKNWATATQNRVFS
jgi:hypothetical protein